MILLSPKAGTKKKARRQETNSIQKEREISLLYRLTIQKGEGGDEKKIEKKRKTKKCSNTNPEPIFISKQASFL